MKTSTLVVAMLTVLVIASIATPFVVSGLFAPPAKPFPLDECVASDSIVVENAKTTGVANASVWNVTGAGHPDIQGFATDISVNKGETVTFKIKTNATNYRLDIYRMGYYGGNGARKWDTVQVSLQQAQSQPACQTDSETGLLDCGNWQQSATWNVPSNAVSGIYFAKAVRNDNESVASHIVFIVRDDDCGSDLLFQTSDTTWQAYNDYGDVTTPGSQNGKSLYGSASAAAYEQGQRAYKVSYNRPFNTGKPTPPRDTKHSWVFNAEYPMVRWLEANGYDVSYTTGVDSARRGEQILAGHKVFLSVGHDEYWSGEQRANVEAARDAGVHLAFFSGNELYWKTRWENNYRTLVCYKESMAGTENIDPDATNWTGTWRDPRYSPPADGGRPENALIGAIFTAIKFSSHAIEVPAAYRQLRLWRNVDFGQNPGPVTTLAPGTLSFEWGSDLDNGYRPAGTLRLSSTTKSDVLVLLDHGSPQFANPGTATHNLTLYRHSSGALVFGASTVQWSWGLDNDHAYNDVAFDGVIGNQVDNRMKQATVNLFADMGVQPGSIQSPQTAATQSTDTTPPTSAISSPSPFANVEALSTVTITGTASDSGGLVAGVEVSVDNGTTWHPATGLTSWSYSWKPATVGAATIKSRAVDDSGRLETPSAGVTVSVAPPTCACGGCTDDAPSNKSLSLNGTDHYVRVPSSSSINITGPLTVEAWIKTTASNRDQGIVERYDDNGSTDGGYALRLRANNKLAFYTLRDRDLLYDFVEGSTTISTGVWHHVAGVFDGGQLRVYVDGVLDGVKASTFAPVTGTTDLLIGAKSPDASGRFQGLIDEVMLTAGALYATNFVPSTRLTATGNTKGLWRFESIQSTTVADASCNANDGTVVGGAGLSSDVGEAGTSGLKGHWRLDEGAGTSAADSSGIGNTGTLNSASWGAGKVNNAVSFNGTSSYVNMGASSSLEATDALTLSAWIFPTGPGSDNTLGGTIINKEGEYQLVRFPNGSIRYALANTVPGWNYVDTGGNAPLNRWTHVAIVYNNSSVETYINGVRVHTQAGAGAIVDNIHPSDDDFRVGGRQVWNQFFQGRIDEVRFYNRGLSTADVQSLANEPVGYWKFDENTGTTAADSSGNTFDGTLTNGPTWTTGRVNSALTFDGTNDYVQVGAQAGLEMSDTLTISAWIFPTGAGSDVNIGGTIVNKEGEYQLVRLPNGGIRWAIANTDPGWNYVNTGASAPLNQWTHVAFVYNKGTARTFINGSLVHTYAGSGVIVDNIHPSEDEFRIGGRQGWNQHFQGKIDEVRIYNRGLSAGEVQILANELAGYWQFDENSGLSAADSSGNAFDGILNGPAWTTGKTNSGLSFDGVDDYVQVGTKPGLVMSDALTIAAWIFPTGAGSDGTLGGIIVNKEGEYQLFRLPNGSIRWVLANIDPGWNLVSTAGSAPLNQWTHVALVYSNGTAKTYINGSVVDTRLASGVITDAHPSHNDFRIGGRQAWNQFFQGKIDEVRIYRIPLQDSDIATLAQ